VSSSTTMALCSTDGNSKLGPTWNNQNAASSGQVLHDKLYFFFVRRNAQPAAARLAHTVGIAPSFHGLVDPSSPTYLQTLIFEDVVSATIGAGVCEVQFGFIEHITATVIADLVGVGFRAGTGTGDQWHAFVNDCPTGAAPVTVLHDFDTGIAMTDPHHLAIVIDGPSKTIGFWIDGVEVSTFTPAAPLDRMAAAANASGPQAMMSAVVPINGDVILRCHAGGFPQLRMGFRPEEA
jgi:hypothetical protein